ncbi:hypothetical protein ACTFIZ_008886 [Dictyostelium cf. discoideum]
MNNHFKFYFFILLCSIFYISFSKSQTIDEYNCLSNIFSKFNLSNSYPQNSTGGYGNVCNSKGISCSGGVVKTISISGRIEQSPQSAILTPNELFCLPNLDIILLQYIRVSTDVLFTKFGSVNSIYLQNIPSGAIDITTIDRPFPPYITYSLSCYDFNNTILNSSYINNVKYFYFRQSFVYFNINEGTNFTNLIDIEIWTLNIPDFSSYKSLYSVYLTLSSDYNKTTISNYAKIESFSIRIVFPQNSLPIPSFIGTNHVISSVSIIGQPFSKPSSMIDMSVGYRLNEIYMNNAGVDFNVNGEFPLILSKHISVNFQFGSFKTVPAFANVSTGSVTISRSGLTDLSSYGGSANFLDYSDNNLTGTIDPSYCDVELIVTNNKLTGTIPSCFTCYFGYPIVSNTGSWSTKPFYDRFKGNQFTNFIPNPGCTTFAPQVRPDPNSYGYFISGNDIGFDGNYYYLNGTYRCLLLTRLRSGKEINCVINNSLYGVRYASILNTWHKKNYTFAFISSPPDVSLVSVSLNTLTIGGTYFSSYIGQSIQTVKIENIDCAISATNFFEIVCTTLSTIPSSTSNSQLLTISNSNETKKFYIQTSDGYSNSMTCSNDCSTNSNGICDLSIGVCICNIGFEGIDCSPILCIDPNCSGFGICNTTIGECKCDTSHQGYDCSLPFLPCKSDCSEKLNQGSCNNQTGNCECSPNYQGSDCTISIPKTCPNDCTNPNNGKCNSNTGQCECNDKFQGFDCGIVKSVHYITSVIPCTIYGGEVSIIGWFGNDGALTLTSFNVSIGILDCILTSINQTVITCNLGAGKGTKDIKIINSIHTNVIFIGYGLFNYQNPIKTCPNDCTSPNNGKCNSNTGECECNDTFKGFDCSTIIEITTPSTNSSIDIDTGGVTIGNQNTNYEISILSLNEISIDGSTIIKSHPLKGNWSIDNNEGTDTTTTTTNSNIFKFSQKLINNTCTIIYTIEEIKLKDKSFTFGSTSFTVEKDSLKLSVLIKDYQYQSSLNTLQLIFYSAAVDTNNDDDNDCNKKETSINKSNLNNQQNLNYIQISKNSKTLVGRFINQVIADSRPTFMSSTIINDNNKNNNNNSIKIGLNLPHCFECLIDPDFSILVSSDFKESCDKSSQKNKWIIPVSVVVSVVGFSIIVTISIILYMKHKYTFKIISTKLKPYKKPK